jgi:MOSC domain-containing protein YiiM
MVMPIMTRNITVVPIAPSVYSRSRGSTHSRGKAGTAGENVTIEGLDWELVVPGTRMKLGDEVLLEIASYTSPCKTIRESFLGGEFVRISQKVHPGWSRVYARVLSEGEIHFGDHVELLVAPE